MSLVDSKVQMYPAQDPATQGAGAREREGGHVSGEQGVDSILMSSSSRNHCRIGVRHIQSVEQTCKYMLEVCSP